MDRSMYPAAAVQRAERFGQRGTEIKAVPERQPAAREKLGQRHAPGVG
jgi:hypothetical protein